MTLFGDPSCTGFFTGGSGVSPAIPDAGVIFASGAVGDIAGPNEEGGKTILTLVIQGTVTWIVSSQVM